MIGQEDARLSRARCLFKHRQPMYVSELATHYGVSDETMRTRLRRTEPVLKGGRGAMYLPQQAMSVMSDRTTPAA